MTLGALSMAWVAAEAGLPLEWQLAGVWLDQDKPGEWQAVANGPGGPTEVEIGHGRLRDRLGGHRGSGSGPVAVTIRCGTQSSTCWKPSNRAPSSSHTSRRERR